MEVDESERLDSIWAQEAIPVFFATRNGPLLIRLPEDPQNYSWLKRGRRRSPTRNVDYQSWEAPKAWLDELVPRTLAKYRRLYLIQPRSKRAKCVPACWHAKGYICVCSCGGANHGSGHPLAQWRTVSGVFATDWRGEHVACRLISARA